MNLRRTSAGLRNRHAPSKVAAKTTMTDVMANTR